MEKKCKICGDTKNLHKLVGEIYCEKHLKDGFNAIKYTHCSDIECMNGRCNKISAFASKL